MSPSITACRIASSISWDVNFPVRRVRLVPLSSIVRCLRRVVAGDGRRLPFLCGREPICLGLSNEEKSPIRDREPRPVYKQTSDVFRQEGYQPDELPAEEEGGDDELALEHAPSSDAGSADEMLDEGVRLTLWQKLFCWVPSSKSAPLCGGQPDLPQLDDDEAELNPLPKIPIEPFLEDPSLWGSADECEVLATMNGRATEVKEIYHWSEPIELDQLSTSRNLRIQSYDIVVLRRLLPSSYSPSFGSSYQSPLPVRAPSISQIVTILRGLPLCGFRPFLSAECAGHCPSTFSLMGDRNPAVEAFEPRSCLDGSRSVTVQPDAFWYWNGGLDGRSQEKAMFEVWEILPRFQIVNESNFDLDFIQPIGTDGSSHIVQVLSGMSKLYHFTSDDSPYKLQLRISSTLPLPPKRLSGIVMGQHSSLESQLEPGFSIVHDKEPQEPAKVPLRRRFRRVVPQLPSPRGVAILSSESESSSTSNMELVKSESEEEDEVEEQLLHSTTDVLEEEEEEDWRQFRTPPNTRPWSIPIPITSEEALQNTGPISCDDEGFWNIYKMCVPLRGEDGDSIVAAIQIKIDVDPKTGMTCIMIAPSIAAPIHVENHTRHPISILQVIHNSDDQTSPLQFALPDTEVVFSPETSAPFWLCYPPSAIVAQLESNMIQEKQSLDLFKSCRAPPQHILLQILKDVLRHLPDGRNSLMSGAIDIIYRTHRGDATHHVDILKTRDPGPIKQGR